MEMRVEGIWDQCISFALRVSDVRAHMDVYHRSRSWLELLCDAMRFPLTRFNLATRLGKNVGTNTRAYQNADGYKINTW